jgi:hypothetical protein
MKIIHKEGKKGRKREVKKEVITRSLMHLSPS